MTHGLTTFLDTVSSWKTLFRRLSFDTTLAHLAQLAFDYIYVIFLLHRLQNLEEFFLTAAREGLGCESSIRKKRVMDGSWDEWVDNEEGI